MGVAQQQQRELTEKVDHMTAKILVAEEALAQKDERIEQLEREVVNLRVQVSTCEKVASDLGLGGSFCRVQVSTY